jgi:hypothetical protein
MRGRGLTARWTEFSAILGLLAYLAGTDTLIDVPLCVSRYMGRPCPSCGTIRSLWHLLHGRFSESWALNPIGYVALAVLARRAIVLTRPSRLVVRSLENRWLEALFLASYLTLGCMRLVRVL